MLSFKQQCTESVVCLRIVAVDDSRSVLEAENSRQRNVYNFRGLYIRVCKGVVFMSTELVERQTSRRYGHHST